MGTANQVVWSATSGLLVVPSETQSTTRPFSPVQTTGANITYAVSPPPSPTVSGEEQEWASLLASERKKLIKRGRKGHVVNKAIRQLRYGR